MEGLSGGATRQRDRCPGPTAAFTICAKWRQARSSQPSGPIDASPYAPLTTQGTQRTTMATAVATALPTQTRRRPAKENCTRLAQIARLGPTL
jgi:hypothetical protein